MIDDSFDARTLANMEIALDRACVALGPGSDKHKTRRLIARKIVKCANGGDKTLGGLTAAGRAAVAEVLDNETRASFKSEPKVLAASRTAI